MSKFKALLKFIGIGALIGAVLGYIMANSKYGTGVTDILGGTRGGTEEEQGVTLFWLLIQAGIFFGFVTYIVAIVTRTKTGKAIKDFFQSKF